jgi:hypothetical protein
MRTRTVHGILSLFFVSLSFILGIVIVSRDSPIIGGLLALTLILFFILIPSQICNKCPARNECGHVLLGKLSRRLAPYCADAMGLRDLIILVIFILPLVIVPQFWLFKYPVFLILFWTMMLVSAADILLFVCPGCGNTKCPLNKGFGRE